MTDFFFVIDFTKDQKRLVLVGSESFSLAAYCFFFILMIVLTSRLACLNRSKSRVLSRLIPTFLNLFFTLIGFRSSFHGYSFTFRGLLVGMCWSTYSRDECSQHAAVRNFLTRKCLRQTVSSNPRAHSPTLSAVLDFEIFKYRDHYRFFNKLKV